MEETTFKIIAHALGVDIESAQNAKTKKARILPTKFYRNRFCAGEDHSDFATLSQCMRDGIMSCSQPRETLGGARMWYVTDRGIEQFRVLFTHSYPLPDVQKYIEKINQFGGATLTTDPFEKVALLIFSKGKISDHDLLTKKQAEKLIPFSYESDSIGIGRVKYFFKPIKEKPRTTK